jgi:chorismate synthase
MNSFGRIFRVSLFGESHGEGIGVLIDGCPAGLPLEAADFAADLERRRPGAEGTTPRRETDRPLIGSGVWRRRTTGAPILIRFLNRNVRSRDYEALRHLPRPGHADFTAERKYGGFQDPRGGGQFSGRMTAALVAAGVVAKKVISGIRITAVLREAGGSTAIKRAVRDALTAKDSIGGIVECRAVGVPAGLGEPFFDSAESLLSHLVFAVPGVKGIEFGSGFACSRMRGSEANDILVDSGGTTRSNHAGGINGGLTNGNELVFRVVVKPTSSIPGEQLTVDLRTGKAVRISIRGRHDACFALRVPVIIEAAAAVVLADLMLLEQRVPRIMEG